ncbi:hypothetical protein NE237_008483 [Protea cynaroides]|uniref:Uncharacterized protein n=1 Tax=Protea cynaroides TaxID=273540 RepID=A0A9Q0KVS2_9MAGN|nr:hypothetical protein NE237_008483 [Protea cynaroides]
MNHWTTTWKESMDDDMEALDGLVQPEDETPVVLKLLITLQPVADSADEEDFGTLRAIRKRLAEYDSDALKKTESTFVHDSNNSLTSEQDTHNILFANGTIGEALDNDFPDYGHACSAYEHSVSGVDPRASHWVPLSGINRLLLCYLPYQKNIIASLHLESSQGLPILMQKKSRRVLSHKKDVHGQLILVTKSKNSQNLKLKILMFQLYKTVLTTLFPLSLHRQPWSQVEKENLAKGIKQQIQEMLFDKSMVLYSGSEESFGASDAGQSGVECEARWRKMLHPSRKRWKILSPVELKLSVEKDPSLNLGEWTEEENNKLETVIKEHGYCWSKVAAAVPLCTDSQCRRRWKILNQSDLVLVTLPLSGRDSIPDAENGNHNGKEKKKSSDTSKSMSKRFRAKAQIHLEEALNPTNGDDAEKIGTDDTSSEKRKAPNSIVVKDYQDHSSTPRDSTCLKAMNDDIDAVGGNHTTKEKKMPKPLSRSNKSTKPASDCQSLSSSAEDLTTSRIRNADDVETSGVDYATSNKKNAAKACTRKRKHSGALQDSHNLGMEDYNPKKKK